MKPGRVGHHINEGETRFSKKIKMRFFIFLKVFVFNQIFAAEIHENLKIYQNLTGITDENWNLH